MDPGQGAFHALDPVVRDEVLQAIEDHGTRTVLGEEGPDGVLQVAESLRIQRAPPADEGGHAQDAAGVVRGRGLLSGDPEKRTARLAEGPQVDGDGFRGAQGDKAQPRLRARSDGLPLVPIGKALAPTTSESIKAAVLPS